MSRSFRRSPFISRTAYWYKFGSESDKWWKTYWHRKMRAASFDALHEFDVDEDFLPHYRKIAPRWASPKEGKRRFDPIEHPELMRK